MENTTYHTKVIKGIPLGIPNRISKENKCFYISYNNRDINLYGSNTTALYINETGQFLILNGNHTKEYEDLNTLEEHLKYFYSNIDKVNSRSEHNKIFKIVDNKGVYVDGGY